MTFVNLVRWKQKGEKMFADRPEEGWLRECGYKVGKAGLSKPDRWGRLVKAQGGTLPARLAADYRGEWGEPGSSKRLEKLANTLAAFVRTAKKKRTADMDAAIKDWEYDLALLKTARYDGKGHTFQWPSTEVETDDE